MKKNYVILAKDFYESLNVYSVFIKKIVVYIMYLLVEKISKSGKEDLNVNIGAIEFIRYLGLSDGENNYAMLKNGINEIIKLTTKTIANNGNQIISAWFSRCVEFENVGFILTFTPDIANAIYDIQKSEQTLDLFKICDVKNSHTLRLYDLCLSKKRERASVNWNFEMSIGDLKKFFGLEEDSYKNRTNSFNSIVVKPAVTELNNINRDFHVTILNITKCKRIIGYQFSCEWLRK